MCCDDLSVSITGTEFVCVVCISHHFSTEKRKLKFTDVVVFYFLVVNSCTCGLTYRKSAVTVSEAFSSQCHVTLQGYTPKVKVQRSECSHTVPQTHAFV